MDRSRNWTILSFCYLCLISGLNTGQMGDGMDKVFEKMDWNKGNVLDDRLYPNLGIVFKEVAKLQTTREVYTIHLTTELPNVGLLLRQVNQTLTESKPECANLSGGLVKEACEKHRERFEQLDMFRQRVQLRLSQKVQQLTQNIPVLGRKTSLSHRHKRGVGLAIAAGIPLFGGLGVGIWAHKRIDQLQNKISLVVGTASELHKGQAKLASELSKLTNFTTKAFLDLNRQLDDLRADVNKVFRRLQTHIRVTQKVITNEIRVNSHISNLALALQEYAVSVDNTLDRLITIFHELNLGRLSLELLTYDQLQEVLDKVNLEIGKQLPGYEIVYKDASDYFDNNNIIASIVNYTLIVQIPAYIKRSNQALFTLYRVHSVHVPYNVKTANELPETVRQYSYTKAKLESSYFAASTDDYMTLSTELLMECERRGGVYICPQAFVHTHRQRASCLSSVYWHHSLQEIQERCNYQYYYNMTPEAEIHSNGSFFLVSNLQIPWSLLCHDKAIPSRESGERYVLIERKSLCHCALTTAQHYLPPIIADCDGPSPGIKIKYPFNAIVQYHYSPNRETKFNYISVHDEEQEDEVPELKVKKTPTEGAVLEEDAETLPVSVERVFDMIDNQGETFLTQADYLKSRSDVRTWFSGKGAVWGVILIMSMFGAIALIIVICQAHQSFKIKSLVTTALVGSKLMHDIPAAKAENPEDATEWITTATLGRMYIVIIGLACLLIYYLAKQFFRKFLLYRHVLPSRNSDESTHESQIFMEIAGPKEIMRVYLTTVRAAAIQLMITTPALPKIVSISNYLWYTTMRLDWGNQVFYIYDLSRPMKFPSVVPIPLYRRRKAERIMKGEYSVRILILQDIYYALDTMRNTPVGPDMVDGRESVEERAADSTSNSVQSLAMNE